jgi:hypothetical protein
MRAALATMLLQRERDTRRILLEEGVGVADALPAAETSAGSKYDGRTSGRGRACRLTSR